MYGRRGSDGRLYGQRGLGFAPYTQSFDSSGQPAPSAALGLNWTLVLHADPSETWNLVEYAIGGYADYGAGINYQPLPASLVSINGGDIQIKMSPSFPDFQRIFAGQITGNLRIRVTALSGVSWSDQFNVAEPGTIMYQAGGVMGNVSSTGVFSAQKGLTDPAMGGPPLGSTPVPLVGPTTTNPGTPDVDPVLAQALSAQSSVPASPALASSASSAGTPSSVAAAPGVSNNTLLIGGLAVVGILIMMSTGGKS